MIELKTNAIMDTLKDRGFKPEFQKETNQIYLILEMKGREFPLFFRVYESNELVQLLTFLPAQFEKEKRDAVGRLLHLFNKELDMPGFGMDEFAGVGFYRCMIPTPDNKLDERLLDGYLNAIQLACKTFYPTIEAVIAGAADVDDLLEKAQSNA